MTRKPVQSSNLKSVGYEPKTKTLEVEFQNGGVFRYPGVTAARHAALVAARSPGGYFHQHIRSQHVGVAA
jgi:hypothetical protein